MGENRVVSIAVNIQIQGSKYDQSFVESEFASTEEMLDAITDWVNGMDGEDP